MVGTQNKGRANARAGFNLIEAAIVLGIVGLVVGGIWAAASAAYENMRQQTVSKNILAFAQNVKNFYANSSATTIDTEANLITGGLLPKDMVSGSNIIHPWGGTTTASGQADIASSNGSFTITFNNLPQSSCRTLIVRNANASSGVITAVILNGSVITNYTTAACTTGDTNDVGFSFNIQG